MSTQIRIETKKKTIDGKEYSTTLFLGRESFKIKMRLVKLLVPAFSLLADAIGKGESLSSIKIDDLDFEKIGLAVSKVFDAMNEDDFINFILRMLRSTSVTDEKGTRDIDGNYFDLFFAGNLTTLYKLLFFVVQVNYPDFFLMGEMANNTSIGNEQDI